jgi:hypothetical protein
MKKMKKGCKVNTVTRNNLKYENVMAMVQTLGKPHKPKRTVLSAHSCHSKSKNLSSTSMQSMVSR